MVKTLSSAQVSAENIEVLHSSKDYRKRLLSLIQSATKRIYITALYVQDDEAGREVLHALYQAKQANAQLDIKVFVDYHRAQRGLIGEEESLGNRALYLALEQEYKESIDIHGVAVKPKELLGVLHLKGMVFDNTLLFSGASINNIYMHVEERYRLDRYHVIESIDVANSFANMLTQTFADSGLCPRLNQIDLPSKEVQRKNITRLKAKIKRTHYVIEGRIETINDGINESNAEGKESSEHQSLKVTPLLGFGRRKKQLNTAVRNMVQQSQSSLLIFTPYFNLPKPLTRDVVNALKRGVKVTLVVGDKTANDFYIKNPEDFSTIGIIPYLYEILLAKFLKRWKRYLTSGLLEVRLWKDGDNSFHQKGIIADQRVHLITGSNLNPRAWSLDIENGLLIDDPEGTLKPSLEAEKNKIFANTKAIECENSLQKINDYPEKPKKLIKKINMVRIDKILKRFL